MFAHMYAAPWWAYGLALAVVVALAAVAHRLLRRQVCPWCKGAGEYMHSRITIDDHVVREESPVPTTCFMFVGAGTIPAMPED